MNHYIVTATGQSGKEYVYRTEGMSKDEAAREAFRRHGWALRTGVCTDRLKPCPAVALDLVATIEANREGGTVALNGSPVPLHGYLVGGLVSPLIVEDDESTETFVQYLYDRGTGYLGWWIDEETGETWIDGLEWYESTSRAVSVARRRSEVVIYDLEARKLRVL